MFRCISKNIVNPGRNLSVFLIDKDLVANMDVISLERRIESGYM